LDEAVVLCVAEIGIQKVILEGDAEAVIEAANRNQTHLKRVPSFHMVASVSANV
jgi:hypothetical protein